MPTFKSFAAFGAELERLNANFKREEGKRILRQAAEAAEVAAERVASGALGGDPKFSGWEPYLDTRLRDVRDGVLLTPTRSSAGPWTVGFVGRNQGNAGGLAGPGIGRDGTTRRRKDGSLAKVRTRKARRWNGTTRGKFTADAGQSAMERAAKPIIERGVKRATMKRFDVT